MSTKVKGEAIKEGSIPLSALEAMPYAYPVKTYDGKENKVIGLGGDCQYAYVGELVASEFGTPTEEKIVGEATFTEYLYQSIYNGKYFDVFESYFQEKYITLYIGNDVDGYTSNKVYISEDANNLTYCDFNFIPTFGPRSLQVAISPDYILHCRNYWHYANKNSKVFFASMKQQLDVNLIPDTVLKTTPQTLSDTDKNQALANLGIDSVVWKYMCNPIVLHNGMSIDDIPQELLKWYDNLNQYDFIYLYPNMYRVDLGQDGMYQVVTPYKFNNGIKFTGFGKDEDNNLYNFDGICYIDGDHVVVEW